MTIWCNVSLSRCQRSHLTSIVFQVEFQQFKNEVKYEIRFYYIDLRNIDHRIASVKVHEKGHGHGHGHGSAAWVMNFSFHNTQKSTQYASIKMYHMSNHGISRWLTLDLGAYECVCRQEICTIGAILSHFTKMGCAFSKKLNFFQTKWPSDIIISDISGWCHRIEVANI